MSLGMGSVLVALGGTSGFISVDTTEHPVIFSNNIEISANNSNFFLIKLPPLYIKILLWVFKRYEKLLISKLYHNNRMMTRIKIVI